MDILLDRNGDLVVTKTGDIRLENSIAQKVRIRLLWLLGEWRWDIDKGLPYREDLLIKNPHIMYFQSQVRMKLLEIDEINSVTECSVTFDNKTRKGLLTVTALAGQEVIREEVDLQWQITE